MPNEERQRLNNLKTKQRELQLTHFLEKFPIRSAKIKGIGDSRKATLRSYGIETAADVERQRIDRISGFGPAMVGALVAWRTSVERRFAFDPRQPISPADVAAITSDIARKSTDLVTQLRQEFSKLRLASDNLRGERSAVQASAAALWQSLKQTELDTRFVASRTVPVKVAGFFAVIVAVFLCASLFGGGAEPSIPPNRTQAHSEASPNPSTVPAVPTKGSPPSQTSSASTSATRPSNGNASALITLAPNRGSAIPLQSEDKTPSQPSSVGKPLDRTQPVSPKNSFEDFKPGADPKSDGQPKMANKDVPPVPMGGPFVPITGPIRSVNKSADVRWIQLRLQQLGFLKREPTGMWDRESQEALRDFKIVNKLASNSAWDISTEQKLNLDRVTPATASFLGGWSLTPGCVVAANSTPPLLISTRSARSDGGLCEFLSVVPEGTGWRITGKCLVNNQTRNINATLVVQSDRLVWSSSTGGQPPTFDATKIEKFKVLTWLPASYVAWRSQNVRK